MKHLSIEELIDLTEPDIASSRSRLTAHLSTCAECRRQVAELRQMLSGAADAAVPEPSPLFWDHLWTRIREEIAAEPAPWRWRVVDLFVVRRFVVSLLACGLAVLIAIGFMRSRSDRASSVGYGSVASLESGA